LLILQLPRVRVCGNDLDQYERTAVAATLVFSLTPIRVVASLHDTSVAMIERTYSKFITDHSDALSRRALLDTTRLVGENVVTLKVRS
jgi:hypothetical protein